LYSTVARIPGLAVRASQQSVHTARVSECMDEVYVYLNFGCNKIVRGRIFGHPIGSHKKVTSYICNSLFLSYTAFY
jgi:hypothetical protein